VSVEQADCAHGEDGDYLKEQVHCEAGGDHQRRQAGLVLGGLSFEHAKGDEQAYYNQIGPEGCAYGFEDVIWS